MFFKKWYKNNYLEIILNLHANEILWKFLYIPFHYDDISSKRPTALHQSTHTYFVVACWDMLVHDFKVCLPLPTESIDAWTAGYLRWRFCRAFVFSGSKSCGLFMWFSWIFFISSSSSCQFLPGNNNDGHKNSASVLFLATPPSHNIYEGNGDEVEFERD